MHASEVEISAAEFFRAKKNFHSMRLVYEYGDRYAAFILASQTAHLLRQLLLKLNDASFDVPQLERDVRYLESHQNNPTEDQEFEQISFRLERDIRQLEEKCEKLFPENSDFGQGFGKMGKSLLFLIAMVAGVLVMAFILDKARTWNHGLVGEYFNERNLSNKVLQRVDRTINFDWEEKAPIEGKIPADNFSVRWTGYVKPPHAGLYAFTTHSDEGVRLFIDDQVLINNWAAHSNTVDQATIFLSTSPHKIRLEYYDADQAALVKLLWKYEGKRESEVIGVKYFYPDENYL